LIPLLSLEKVSKSYRTAGQEGANQALEEVTLSLETGTALGIVGESGAGKSTLIRIIMGLERPTSGTVRFDGRPISFLSERRRWGLKKDLQMIWQDPVSYLNPFMSVEQLIAEPLMVFGLGNRKEQRERVRELAGLTGLEEAVLNHRPRVLSGGQAQRVAIARALSLKPRLLLCDEILTGLDSPRQVQILDLLTRLRDQMGLTVLFVSHDLAAVGYLCRRLAVLKGGKILEEAETHEFLQKPKHPYSAKLLQSAL
jgi:ABC-type glutathione transport system ATPase component